MNEPTIATSDDLAALYQALLDADERGDTMTLAGLGWVLFAVASNAEHAYRKTADQLAELRASAGAACAGGGSPASLVLLRYVLAKHGWLPKQDVTPLQALAAPQDLQPAVAAVS